MAHWTNQSTIHQLQRFAAYGVNAARIPQVNGPIQWLRTANTARFPFSMRKIIGRLPER